MPTILEELKARLAAAQARQAIAQQRYQAAAAEVNAASADFNVWNNAVTVEMREEAARAAEAAKDQIQIPITLQPSVDEALVLVPEEDQTQELGLEDEEPVNKTNLVREILSQSQTGIAPRAIWLEFHQRAPKASRNYLYSVLKRLRDKKQVDVRRGKYMLKAKPAVTVDETFVGGATTVN
jgi:hypothetical protein